MCVLYKATPPVFPKILKIILVLPNFGSISSDVENTLHLYGIQKSPKNLPKSKKDEVKFTTHIFQIGLGRAGGVFWDHQNMSLDMMIEEDVKI